MAGETVGDARIPWPWAVLIVVLVTGGLWVYDALWGIGSASVLTVALVGGILAAVGVLATNLWAGR